MLLVFEHYFHAVTEEPSHFLQQLFAVFLMTAHILFEEVCFENEEVESSQSSKQRQTFRVDLDSFQHLRVEDEDAFDVEGLVHIQQDLVEEKRE